MCRRPNAPKIKAMNPFLAFTGLPTTIRGFLCQHFLQKSHGLLLWITITTFFPKIDLFGLLSRITILTFLMHTAWWECSKLGWRTHYLSVNIRLWAAPLCSVMDRHPLVLSVETVGFFFGVPVWWIISESWRDTKQTCRPTDKVCCPISEFYEYHSQHTQRVFSFDQFKSQKQELSHYPSQVEHVQWSNKASDFQSKAFCIPTWSLFAC